VEVTLTGTGVPYASGDTPVGGEVEALRGGADVPVPPAPGDARESSAFEADLRAVGHTGRVTVGEDLASFTFDAP
jgi:hypothetical protein